MKLCFVFMWSSLLSTLAFADLTPHLFPRCALTTYPSESMPEERLTFWDSGRDLEIHDLAAERIYDRELVRQIETCYAQLEKVSLNAEAPAFLANLESVTFSSVAEETSTWQVPSAFGAQIFAARTKYLQNLATRFRHLSSDRLISFAEGNPHLVCDLVKITGIGSCAARRSGSLRDPEWTYSFQINALSFQVEN